MRTASVPATALAPPAATVRSRSTTGSTICVYPFRFDPDLGVEVPLVRWPTARVVRERLAGTGAACLLVVGAAERAPGCWTEVEDWVREYAPRIEFVTRAITVARRADLLTTPWCDGLGNVRFRSRTVPLPSTQVDLARALLDRFGDLVPDAEIRERCDASGVSCHAEAVKTALRRLKDSLVPVGLRLTRVRGAGYLLDRSD
jgi:hypothetical protein